jgi:hypothetical protein
MAYEIPGFSFTLPSAADYRTGAGQFRFVNVNSSGKAVAAGAAGACIGVRQNKPNLNEAMTIVNSGIVFVEAGAAVANGALVTSDATGRAITAGVGNAINGEAMETASAAGVQIAVLLHNSAAKA